MPLRGRVIQRKEDKDRTPWVEGLEKMVCPPPIHTLGPSIYLVAQHEAISICLRDLAPADQHAARGGGQSRHVGGLSLIHI